MLNNILHKVKQFEIIKIRKKVYTGNISIVKRADRCFGAFLIK